MLGDGDGDDGVVGTASCESGDGCAALPFFGRCFCGGRVAGDGEGGGTDEANRVLEPPSATRLAGWRPSRTAAGARTRERERLKLIQMKQA